jgi:hypothetical protein
VATSILPSPLKSADTTPAGSLPTANEGARLVVPSDCPPKFKTFVDKDATGAATV